MTETLEPRTVDFFAEKDLENLQCQEDSTFNGTHANQTTIPLSVSKDVDEFTNEKKTNDNEKFEYDDDDSYPDGGYQAWLVVLGAFMGILPIWGIATSLGVLESHISEHQLANVSSSVVSWIFSLHLMACSACCVFSGAYFDRNGEAHSILVGSVIFVFGIFMTSISTKLWHFVLAFSLCCGCATGVLVTPLLSCIATWFYRKRAIATGVATIGSSIGGVVIPVTLRSLYASAGFPWAIRVVGFMSAACLTLSTLLTRERITPLREPFKTKKEAVKYYWSMIFNWRYFTDGKFVWCALALAIAENGVFLTGTYLSSYVVAHGYKVETGYTVLIVVNSCGILGRYIPGYLADHYFGRFNVVIVITAACVIADAALWLPFGGKMAVLWVYAAIYGFLAGAIFSLTPVCIGQISRTCEFGKRYSTAYLLVSLMTLVVIPIGGALAGGKTIPEYNRLIIFTSALLLIAVVCYTMSRTLAVGWKLCKF
ncbi:HBL281Cp [Eremothecium sinecaudum]|uniref:HBL281Cp n=1 Tax=Eremothecium sinecaudum TaxID=45286 RepID=A0A125RDU5_9SACH|nr:HBL281Cp [Eremothecium sinecaudum]AMD18621.1 HBL281Cp [Eremothecium sinecaudum]